MSAAPAAGLVHVDVGYGLPRRGLPAAASFRRWVATACAEDRCHGPATLAIRLVDAAEGRALNREFRGRDYATNVLSFASDRPEGLPPDLPRPLGDIALCAPVIAAEAATQGKPLRDHFAHLTIHGVLHLLGYEHEQEASAAAMEALEIRLLADLGIADPYHERP